MRILYIYPHPDDESFGPAPAMSKQRRQGHEVYLLTLTKGGATKQRHVYGYSVEEMGEVRYREMQQVADVLDLNGMQVLDLPDSGLKELDPREIERAVEQELIRVQPHVVVTYPVHGVSGFHDHIVTHAVVKRVFLEQLLRRRTLKRLAFHTITQEDAQKSSHFRLNGSTPEEIDCVFEVDEVDVENGHKALDCYETFRETIQKSGIREFIGGAALFEIFQENHNPPLEDLFDKL
jgi:LmbE family N-acetylglucosaminyl deacetylase